MRQEIDLKQWAIIHRGLGNPNRLRILKLLNEHDEMSVTELADELGISFKNTSRNLQILLNLDLVQYQGKKDRVYYSLNAHMIDTIKTILRLTIF